MKAYKSTFVIVLVITLLLSWMAFFGIQIPGTPARLMSAQDMRFGIDIRGGVDAVFQPKDLGRSPTAEELESARGIFETRLDQNNILDRDVTVDASAGTISVQFPWKSDETDFDPGQAIHELGEMGHLTFRDPSGIIVLEGAEVVSAVGVPDNQGSYQVSLKLSDAGRNSFSEATARLIGQPIHIYMDEELISSPTVQTQIDSNECVISNITTQAEVDHLANQINSGALPFSLETQNYSTISAQLGSNALEVMVQAGIWAFILICIGLILIYRASGVVATISLLLQIAGILLMITWTQVTMTLPGIAGIILSIGMGVDANIISAERIREEFRAGKNLDDSVQSGFKMAFSSIFDGNITVLIVAAMMMWWGTGSLLSFAYSLLFGIVMNFVAGVLATRLMTLSLIKYPFMRKPSMFLSDKLRAKAEYRQMSFYGKRKIFFGISGAILLIGLIMTIVQGPILDIQFQGGTKLRYRLNSDLEFNTQLADATAESILPGYVVNAQTTEDFATGTRHLVLSIAGDESVNSEQLVAVTEALTAAFPDFDLSAAETQSVSSAFGQRYFNRAMIALALSALLIILYVWYSFRKIHGLSAAVMALLALLHDALIVFFTFIIFRIPIAESSFVAAVLTILGYSINDTIVIYDRIRENTQRHPGMAVSQLVDTSISQSFTRSIYTSVAVFLSVALVYVFAKMNGLDSVSEFALPMAIGTISGCYSSVCIAGPLWAMWQNHKQKNVKE